MINEAPTPSEQQVNALREGNNGAALANKVWDLYIGRKLSHFAFVGFICRLLALYANEAGVSAATNAMQSIETGLRAMKLFDSGRKQ